MMRFFRKNRIDLNNTLPTFAITDGSASDTGSDFTDLMRNRNNASGWGTTGSADDGSTTMTLSFGETVGFTDVLLVGHNFKNFNLKYYDGTSYVNFSTPATFTDNTLSTNHFNFTEVQTTAIQLKINGTQVANDDKFLKQFIVTETFGTFSIEPEIKPTWDKDRKVSKFLSGKSYVAKSVGAFNCRVRMKSAYNNTDWTLIERLFSSYEGFLVWVTGGDITELTAQGMVREGYRLEDIFLMDIVNEYTPEFLESRWANGMPIDLNLVEVS